ncbi:hypothetical protein IAI10_16290 [Clostridium sp. 19966]|uniref:hypothetical protein n=1 Tax=Clostridium sp. 19966 TaxID=2768166 RepID=UPI0028DF9B45|nr:hypothetical protein [Clostridium sp. 19966]MDT8718227.1 hypothetical protein [Clostridium sp. 19966]
MKIALWSPLHGRGNTTNGLAITLAYSLNYEGENVLINTQYTKSIMEGAFFSGRKLAELRSYDYGIDFLDRLAVGNANIQKEDFYNCSANIIDKRLSIIFGTDKISSGMYSASINNTIKNIVNTADEHYNLEFIDVNSGLKDGITEKVLDNADLVIVTLEQNEQMISEFFTEDHEKLKDKNKKIIIVIGRYDCESKCSQKYIQKNYRYQDEIFSVPYNIDLLDSINNHRILDYFYVNNKFVMKEDNNFFFQEVNRICDRINSFSEENTLKKPLGMENMYTKFKKILMAI